MRRLLPCSILLLGSPVFGATLEVQAESMLWSEKTGWSARQVTLSQEGTTIVAERLTWAPEAERIVLEVGTVRLASGNQLDFARAEATVDRLVLDRAHGTVAPTSIEADQLVLTPDAQQARQLTVDLCSPCRGASPVSIRARDARLEDGTLSTGPGWLRLFDVPVVPLPRSRVPLERQSGLLVPSMSTGDWGLAAAQPLYLTHGRSADSTWTPELRTAWGGRLMQESRWATRSGSGTVSMAGGWDNRLGGRGLADWRIRHGQAGWTLASEGQWTSDHAYRSDYGAGWLDRNLPFQEQRALAAAGPLSVDLWQADNTPLRARQLLWVPTTELAGGVRVRGLQHMMWTEGSLDGDALVQLDRPIDVSPLLQLTPGAQAAGDLDQQQALATLDSTLRLWRRQHGAIERILPAVHLATGRSLQGRALHQLAPSLRYQRTGARTQTVLQGGWLWTERGSEGGWALWRTQGDHLVTQLQLDNLQTTAAPGQISPRLGWIEGRFRTELATLWTVDGHESWGSLWLPLPGFKGSLRGLGQTRFSDRGLLRQLAGVEYTHPSRCLQLSATASVDADRSSPTVAAQLQLYPQPASGLR